MKSISDIIKQQLDACKAGITSNLIRSGQVASGKTMGMLEVKNVSISGGQMLGWKFYQVWETGRKAGKQPPASALMSWVELKLGLTGSEARGAAFAIARKIGREGSSLFRKGGRKDIFTPPFEKLSEQLPKELANLLVEIIIEKK